MMATCPRTGLSPLSSSTNAVLSRECERIQIPFFSPSLYLMPPAWHDGPFLKAARREAARHIPVWLMRQAGRYLPEYRELRAKVSFLALCKDPALCAEVMIKTVQRLGVDAA